MAVTAAAAPSGRPQSFAFTVAPSGDRMKKASTNDRAHRSGGWHLRAALSKADQPPAGSPR